MIERLAKDVAEKRAQMINKLISLYYEQFGYCDMEKYRVESVSGSESYYYDGELLFTVSAPIIIERETGKFLVDLKVEIHKWVDVGGLDL